MKFIAIGEREQQIHIIRCIILLIKNFCEIQCRLWAKNESSDRLPLAVDGVCVSINRPQNIQVQHSVFFPRRFLKI